MKEAKEKCPELVLVNGEDLTKYREMSYKITGNAWSFIFDFVCSVDSECFVLVFLVWIYMPPCLRSSAMIRFAAFWICSWAVVQWWTHHLLL